MFTFKARTEIVIRFFLTAVMLVNALVPTAALAAPVQPAGGREAGAARPRSLAEQKPIFYDPPAITYPERTSPEPDKVKPPVPARDQLEFTITAEPAVVPANGLVTFHVHVANHGVRDLGDLRFSDTLEAGLEYTPDSKSPVSFDSGKKEVTFSIESLRTGKELDFSYSVTVTSSKRDAVKGKVWLHSAELKSGASNVNLKTSVAFSYGLSADAGSQVVALAPEGGWNSLGRVSIHMDKDSAGQNALVMSSPARVAGKGPALQFKLDVYETGPVSVDSQSKLDEQALSLKKQNKTAFKKPAFLEINLDGYVDLKHVPAGQEPYVATYDEEHKIWVKVPILETDPVGNSVTVETAHFSTWGAGLGSSLPQNGANVLLFDQPYTSLFTGAARYSIPVWTPAGRAGVQPEISLSYSSGTMDGVLGDVQAPWVGVGWNIDDVEVVRKITSDENGYGYKNEFALTLNGTMYQLTRDEFHQNRYLTDQAAFLYIERHNYALDNGPSTQNTTGEWWEVVTTDGTRYRLGWNEDSEQLTLMYGYACTTEGLSCITPDGPYASLGYAGKAQDMVALRWRVDRVSEPHGNYMEYHYDESQPNAATTLAAFDRESYLQSISYTGFKDPEGVEPDLAPAYQVYFNTQARSQIGDVPAAFNIWDNVDARYLSDIWSCYGNCETDGSNAIRTYHFGYSLASVPNPNGTLTLTSLEVSGGGYTEKGQSILLAKSPTVRFSYEDKDNRAAGNGDVFKYPRLSSIDNGAGGLLTFTYEHDGRGSNSWYNYRVQNVVADSGMGVAKKQAYSYETPVYSGQGGNSTLGSLTGYTTVTESLLDFTNSDTAIVKTRHTFGTTGLDVGREMQSETLDGSSAVLRKTVNIYVTDNTGAPKDANGNPFPGWNYRYLKESASYIKTGSTLTLISRGTYYNDPFTGNLLVQSTYLGSSLYRKTYYEYVTNPDIHSYMLDKTSRVLLVDASNQVYSDTRYHYDGGLNQAPTRGDLTLVQSLTGNGDQTIDSITDYNIYGNVVAAKAYPSYGTVNIYPTAEYWLSTTAYDSVENDPTQTYPIMVTNPLGQSSSMAYLYKLGVPYETTDANGWVSSITYDGLGRTLSITPPGLEQPGTWYSYPKLDPTGKISAPYAVEMQILDPIAGKYRSVWGIYDGAGRTIQTQTEAGNKLLVSTSLFNAQGLASQQSLPYEVTGAGGNYVYDPGDQFTTTQYDALGRVTSVTAPGDITSQTSYDGLTTTSVDPNGNKVSRTTDGLGRMISVAEFSDPSSVYATTTYFYDTADRLIQVKDPKLTTTTLEYDWLGRKLRMDDPDMGNWTYGYDALGNMTSQTDARGQESTFVYDELNRPVQKSNGDPEQDSTYTYGTEPGVIGMRVAMTDQSGSSTWSYSNFGRTVTETRVIGGEQHWVRTAADWLGRAMTTTYDDGEVLTYSYDELGRPEKLDSSESAETLVDLAYNVLGQISSQSLGNGTVVTNTYDPQTTRLLNRKAENGSTVQLDLSYVYDPNGNITRLTDRQLNETQFYQYDFLNRLTSAMGVNGTPTTAPSDPETYGQQFEYDQVGNIEQIRNWGVAPTQPQGRVPSNDEAFAHYTKSQTVPDGKALLAPAYQEEPTATPTETPTPTGTNTPTVTNTPVPTNTFAGISTPSYTPTPKLDDGHTVSLLHMNGSDGATAFGDASGKAWTANGNAQVDTEQSVFGGASGLFDGSGDYLSVPNHADFDFGSGKFTIDFWVKFNSLETAQQILTKRATPSVYAPIAISIDNTYVYFLSSGNGTTWGTDIRWAYGANIVTGSWYHFAFVRNGNDWRFYLDGVSRASATVSQTVMTNNTSLTVGALLDGSYSLNGWIDELRISKGVARWTSNFDPAASEYGFSTTAPTPTAVPSLEDANTIALLHMNGANGSTAFVDETGRSWNAYGNLQMQTSQSVFGPSSAYFDGTGDYLYSAPYTDFNFGSQDFTIDFWVRRNGNQTNSGTVIGTAQTPTQTGWKVYFSTNNILVFSSSVGGVAATVPMPDLTWTHVAIVRNGDAASMYFDGVLVGSANVAGRSYDTGSVGIVLGRYYANYDSYYFKGWLDELRISKGVARWTGNFTPPNSEYLFALPTATSTPTATATITLTPTPTGTPAGDDSYISALLHMNGPDGWTQFPDEAGNVWTAGGNVQVDTAQSVFGGSSAFFDGSGDSLTAPDSDRFYLNGDFTVDLRVRFNALPATGYTELFFYQGSNSDNSQYFGVQNSNGTYQLIIRARSAGSDLILILKPTTLSINTWYHFAFVRRGNNYMIFQNGVQVGTTVTNATAIPNYGGSAQIGASSLNGWIDELRISKDIALWTSGFPTPASEYANAGSLPEYLMAYWAFEAVTPAATPGTATVSDLAEYDLANNVVTLSNGATLVPDGASGNAVFFDGQDDSAAVANHPEIRKNGSFTLSAWINPSSLVTNRTQSVINKGVSATDFDYSFLLTSAGGTATPTPSSSTPTALPAVDPNGQLVFRVGDLTPNKLIGPVLPLNTWTLVTGVYDQPKGELRLYINGRLIGVEKVTGTISMGSGALSFSPSGNLYYGKLDEVRFYNRALTDEQITQLFGTFATPTPLPTFTPTATSEATFTPTPTALPVSAQQWGTGADGDLTVSGTFNLNTNTNGHGGRTCADGVAYAVSSLGSTIARLNTVPEAGCLNPGDEVMLINLKSSGPSDHNAGAYEFLRVASVNGSSVLFTTMKSRWYGNAWHSDANIGTGANQQRVMLMRVPNYDNVTVTGTLTVNAFDRYKYGVIAFRVAGTLTGTGSISASSRGYGGAIMGATDETAFGGGYSRGGNAVYNMASGTGVGSNGGGAGHATAGKEGGTDSSAGVGASTTYGAPPLSQLFFGSGGGRANLHWVRQSDGSGWSSTNGPNGGAGGGIIFIAGQAINFSGGLSAAGAPRPTNSTPLKGGAGAAGSIRIEGDSVTLGALSAMGGSYSDSYGYGGNGRIAVYYQTSLSISTSSPSAYTGLFGQGPTPTPSPTPISLATPNPYGTGADGNLTIASGSTFNLNVNYTGTRSCADGIAYNVVGLGVSQATLSTSPLPGCLATSDEVMLIHLRGFGPNTGKFEFLRVGGISGNTVYFKTPKVNSYGANSNDDSNLGTGSSQERVMLLRVPNYENVTVNGTLTVNAYDGSKYGVLAFRVHGTLSGAGPIHANSRGFPGEIVGSVRDKGYSPGGNATWNDYARDNANGGGGGHATAGKVGGTKPTDGSAGSVTYGNPQLSLLFLGSGGGRANQELPAGHPGPNGGNGGGIIFIAAQTINLTGGVYASGDAKPANTTGLRGGGGAGGSIRIEGDTIAVSGVAVYGGSSSDTYGAGGAGRAAIYYSTSFSNSASLCAKASTYCQNTSLPVTATVTPAGPTPTTTSTLTPTTVPQGWYENIYTYSTDIPHAVVSVVSDQLSVFSGTYDENGNMTCRVEGGITYIQTYNAENRIASIQKLASGTCTEPGPLTDKWDFTYDGDGVRTGQSYTPYTDGEPGEVEITRYYFGGTYETTNGAWKKYYFLGGQTVMRDEAGFKYFLSDHLGSTSVVLDEQGTILEQQRYLPFGQARVMAPYASVTSTDFTYTGQRNIAGTGLMDYKARFYSPTLGRFIQPDTINTGSGSQSWNRYSYVTNNPIRYNDPTGHVGCDEEYGCGGKLPPREKDPGPDPSNTEQNDIKEGKGKNDPVVEKYKNEHKDHDKDDDDKGGGGRGNDGGNDDGDLPDPDSNTTGGKAVAMPKAFNQNCVTISNTGGWECGYSLDPEEVQELLKDLKNAKLLWVGIIAAVGFAVGFVVGTIASFGNGVAGFLIGLVVAVIVAVAASSMESEFSDTIDEISDASDARGTEQQSIQIRIFQESPGGPIQLHAHGTDSVEISQEMMFRIVNSFGGTTLPYFEQPGLYKE